VIGHGRKQSDTGQTITGTGSAGEKEDTGLQNKTENKTQQLQILTIYLLVDAVNEDRFYLYVHGHGV